MPLPPIVALEIGTSKTIALVGELRENDQVMITGMGEYPSIGVRKGEIIDYENAVACARSVLQAAETSGRVAINQVYMAVSGSHIQSLVGRGSVPVIDKDAGISQEDINNVMEVAKAVNLSSDRDVLHTICQHFCIDEHEVVTNPEGMEGAKLSVDMLILHGVRNRLRNAVRVVRHGVSIEVHDVVFSGLCSSLSVLTPEQKKGGVVTIDMGGGTTDYLVYAGNVVATAGTLGVGGDHITNDIALGFNIPVSQAENLKKTSGSAVAEPENMSKKVSVPPEVGFSGKSIPLKTLSIVINARVDEMFRMIKARLEDTGVLNNIGAGIVLTGGGAHLKGAVKLAESIFDLPCSVGKPRNISGLATATEGPEYATCSGLVQYGFKMSAGQRQAPGLGGILGRFFKR